MARIAYIDKALGAARLAIVEVANKIIAEYVAQGFRLTLRQLYYQFVSCDLIPNTQQSYKRLGSIINDGRLAGLIDWDAIEDRGRNLIAPTTWDSPANIIDACAEQFRIDLWADQPTYIEVWIEKEALAGVFESVCDRLRVPLFPCKGYTSQSEMHEAGRYRIREKLRAKQVVVLHFGDHDPSGIDMTRDITDRLTRFAGATVELRRLALTMKQIRKYEPPPNPAKTTDSRYIQYIKVHGPDSWELDALEPQVLAQLVEDAVITRRDDRKWKKARKREQDMRVVLEKIGANYERVRSFVNSDEVDQ